MRRNTLSEVFTRSRVESVIEKVGLSVPVTCGTVLEEIGREGTHLIKPGVTPIFFQENFHSNIFFISSSSCHQ